MTKAQQTAFDHPVRLAIETMHPRYHSRMRYGLHMVSCVLTLNTGWE